MPRKSDFYWMGRPLNDLTREELIEVAMDLAKAQSSWIDRERAMHSVMTPKQIIQAEDRMRTS